MTLPQDHHSPVHIGGCLSGQDFLLRIVELHCLEMGQNQGRYSCCVWAPGEASLWML